uniref:Uncharacterized protein n=1 Tax=viral metagenome TaxID=1070528 RepID=A0A6H1ZUQ6_9ZZZZ
MKRMERIFDYSEQPEETISDWLDEQNPAFYEAIPLKDDKILVLIRCCQKG